MGDREILYITRSCAFRASTKSQNKGYKGRNFTTPFSAHMWSLELKIGPINTVCDSALIGAVLECILIILLVFNRFRVFVRVSGQAEQIMKSMFLSSSNTS